jgi:formimidoylglutamate deiminase
MPQFFCEQALLSTGWADRVLLDVDDEGTIQAVTARTDAGDATRLPGVVLPGVPNVHSHAHQRAIAGLSERAGHGPDSFWTWRELMYRCLAQLTPEDLQAIAAQLYLEMLRAGYTAVAEFQYLHHAPNGTPYDNIAEMTLHTLAAARETGIGMTCLPVLYAYNGFGGQKADPQQHRFINSAKSFSEIVEILLTACACDANACVGIAPHSLRAVDRDLLSETLIWFQQQTSAAPIHIHIA